MGYEYRPHVDVKDFMEAFGQTVRTRPTTSITRDEQVLRARLVYEEAMEFVAAMGCEVNAEGTVVLQDVPEIDLVEAADALGDVLVVTYGSAHTLGIPLPDVFDEIHVSNMAKLGPDGRPILREGDRKVLKPEGWQAPNIARVLGLEG